MLAFHCWIWLASRNQRKHKQHRISDLQSLLASSSPLLSKRVLCHCIASNFLHRFSWRFWQIDANRLKMVLLLTERLQDVFLRPSENRRTGASDHQKKNKKSPRGIGPRRFPPPGVQIHYGHSRYVPKGYKVLKLVIFLTFDACAAIPPLTSSLHPSPCDIMDPL